jgi:hypothetical protein
MKRTDLSMLKGIAMITTEKLWDYQEMRYYIMSMYFAGMCLGPASVWITECSNVAWARENHLHAT